MSTMSENTSPFKKWVIPVAALGLILFLAYLLLFGDMGNVFTIIGTANLGLYALAFGCVLGSILLNTLAWKSMLKSMSVETKFRRVFNLSLVGNFVDALVPGGWAGDIFKSYLLSKDQAGTGAKATASIVMKNIVELIVTFAALISGIVLLTMNYALEGGILLVVGGAMLLMALPMIIIIYLSANLRATAKVIKIFKRLSARIKGKPIDEKGIGAKLENQLHEYHEGIMIVKSNPKSLARPVLFQVGSWICDILALFAIFASLGYIVGPDKVIITNTLVVGLQTQGVALAGFAQMVSSTIYTVLGISPILAIASSLLAGFASFWFKMGVSFLAFQRTVFAHKGPIFSPTSTLITQSSGIDDMPSIGPPG